MTPLAFEVCCLWWPGDNGWDRAERASLKMGGMVTVPKEASNEDVFLFS